MTLMDAPTRTTPEPGYDGLLSTRAVADAVGISYRKVDYWIRQGALELVQDANGSGTRRRFAPSEVRIVRAVEALRRLGMPIEECAQAVAELRWLPLDHWTGTWISRGRIIDLSTLVD